MLRMDAFSCDPCGKIFNGATPYEAHIISEKHIKKMQQSSCGMNNTSSYYCPTCNNNSSGPIPFKEHLTSARHMKKAGQVETTTNFETMHFAENENIENDFSGISKMELLQGQLYCSFCDKMLNSREQAIAHTSSLKHRKKVLVMENITSNSNKVKSSELDKKLVSTGILDNSYFQEMQINSETCPGISSAFKTNLDYYAATIFSEAALDHIMDDVKVIEIDKPLIL